MRLVPQNPDDEPASVLPERIRAENEQRAMEEKARKKEQKGRNKFKDRENGIDITKNILQKSTGINISGIFSSGDLPQSHESPSHCPQY